MRQSSATDVTYLVKFYPEISHRGRKSLISDFDILGIFVNKKTLSFELQGREDVSRRG